MDMWNTRYNAPFRQENPYCQSWNQYGTYQYHFNFGYCTDSQLNKRKRRNRNFSKYKRQRNYINQGEPTVFKQYISKWSELQNQWRPIENYIQRPKFDFTLDNSDSVVLFKPHTYVKKSVINIILLKDLEDAIGLAVSHSLLGNFHQKVQTYQSTILSQFDTEFNFNSLLLNLADNYLINKIEKIHNPFLILQYELKKYQYKVENEKANEKFLFHGTTYFSLREICNQNFNWRLFGTSTGCKYGQGVSFTPDFYYATHYGNKSFENVMILAKVLVNKHSLGNKLTVVPPDHTDTTTNDICSVYVKYDDSEFCPAYRIHYQHIFHHML